MADSTDSGIYEIVNLTNGKRYIGSAKSFARRWYMHRRELGIGKHHSRHLQRSWDRHGADAFAFRVLELCAVSDLIDREQEALDSLRPAYNISRVAGSTLGVKYTAQGRANVSAALKGKRIGIPRSPESVAKTAAAHRGMKRSSETKAKIAAQALGRKMPERSAEYRAKLSAAQKGRSKSPEHISALQEGRRRRVYTDEQRAAISAKLKEGYAKGSRSRARPPEYREKIANTLREKSKSTEARAKLSKQAADAWLGRPPEHRRRHMEMVRAARGKT
jgi:group I intron endonuclease